MSKEKEVLGFFTSLVVERLQSKDAAISNRHSANDAGEDGGENALPKNAISARARGFLVTISFLNKKLSEIGINEREATQEEFEDLEKQVKMLEVLVKKQEKALLYEMLDAQEAELAAKQKASHQKDESEEEAEACEVLVKEEEEQKFRNFCSDNGIAVKISYEQHNKNLPEEVKKILQEGPGHGHGVGPDLGR